MRAELAQRLAADANGLDGVRRLAAEDPRAGLKAASREFEALFLQMVLKAMRDAVPKSGLFGSQEMDLYQGLLDQQLTQTMSGRGTTGIAAALERQLGRAIAQRAGSDGAAPAGNPEPALSSAASPGPQAIVRAMSPEIRLPSPSDPPGAARAPDAVSAPARDSARTDAPAAGAAPPVREFVGRIWPHALEAGRALGVPAHFLIAHAALETGWGQHEIRRPDGSPSFNLFNVKAGKGWGGETVESLTAEYENGAAEKRVERFRAYGSYAEAFADYAALLRRRYGAVLGQQDGNQFAHGLQRAGYATDPMYADKLSRIIGGATLRLGLSG